MTTTREGIIPLRERRMLADEWRELSEKVLPPEAGDVQRRESRRMFYAGAQSIYALMMGNLDGGSDETTLDLAYMEALEKELAQFGDDLARGEV